MLLTAVGQVSSVHIMTNLTLFVFPGQGSQTVGMGKALADSFPEAREFLQEIDETLKQNLSRLMFEGPEDQLQLTENAQPAIMAASLAVLKVLQKQGAFSLLTQARYVAGHSLGEYSALAAAGTFSPYVAARLLKIRGQAMQSAVPVGQGGMAALIGADLSQAEDIARAAAQGDVCVAANDNAPGQVVISGHMAAIDRAIALAAAKGIKRAIKLNVSAPFHSPLMQPAAETMAEALAEVDMSLPVAPVITNVTAAAESDPATLRDLLVKQVTAPVRWRESMLFAKAQGVQRVVEMGHGNVLTGLAKRIDKDFVGVNVGTPQEIEAFLQGQ